MISQEQIIQMLNQLHQRNMQSIAGVSPQTPNAQLPPIPGKGNGGGNDNGLSMLGVLGGLMDGATPQGNIDPSMITRFNQSMMGMTGQQGINQGLPWLPQSSGQALGQMGAAKIGSFLSALL